MVLEAQLLPNHINVTYSLTECLERQPDLHCLCIDFGRSLQFCHQKFYKEAIFDGFMAHPQV